MPDRGAHESVQWRSMCLRIRRRCRFWRGPRRFWPAAQNPQGFCIIVGTGHIVTAQHGVIVKPLIRYQSGDACSGHGPGNIAVGLGRFPGARSMHEQTGRMPFRRPNRLPYDCHGLHPAAQLDCDMRFFDPITALLRRDDTFGLDGCAGRMHRDMIRERFDLPSRRACHTESA